MSDSTGARAVMWAYLTTGVAIFGLMALIGLALRVEQAQWVAYDPGTFYALMTLHGSGMVVALALSAMGGLWFIMNRERGMDRTIAWSAYAAIVVGVLCVILSIFPGRFAAAWTFLYPLPFTGATWPSWATGAFLFGVALVMLGWTVYCVQLLGCVLAKYGGLRGAVGWDLVFHPGRASTSSAPEPPPQAFAALVTAVDGLFAATGGMLVGVALIVHWIDPSVAIDPLWAKNLTYQFGHTFANLTIYMAIAFVYVALPRYANRKWHTSPVLAIAWWGTLLFVATAYFHHLYMDFVQPRGFQYLGQVASYLAAFPPAVVTIFGGALLIYRSKMRWTMGSMFLYAGLVGWLIGGIGALIDATVPINFSLHNTLWVPAHFHTYLLEGVTLFVLGWIFANLEARSGLVSSLLTRWIVGLGIFGGGALLLLGWYVAGAESVPRRYAVQPVPGPAIAAWASIGAMLLIAGLVFCLAEAVRLARAPKALTAS
jgi:cytochrome c oxidase subunit 1